MADFRRDPRRSEGLRARLNFVTFHMSRRRREMYCGHARLCVCLSAAACPHHCTDTDATSGSGRGCPLDVHNWAGLQSVHGLRCYGIITRTRNASEYKLVLALCLVFCQVSNAQLYRFPVAQISRNLNEHNTSIVVAMNPLIRNRISKIFQ